MLLLHGARLDVTNSNMQTPVDVAHSRVKDVIENRRASVRAKSFSVMEGSLPPPVRMCAPSEYVTLCAHVCFVLFSDK